MSPAATKAHELYRSMRCHSCQIEIPKGSTYEPKTQWIRVPSKHGGPPKYAILCQPCAALAKSGKMSTPEQASTEPAQAPTATETQPQAPISTETMPTATELFPSPIAPPPMAHAPSSNGTPHAAPPPVVTPVPLATMDPAAAMAQMFAPMLAPIVAKALAPHIEHTSREAAREQAQALTAAVQEHARQLIVAAVDGTRADLAKQIAAALATAEAKVDPAKLAEAARAALVAEIIPEVAALKDGAATLAPEIPSADPLYLDSTETSTLVRWMLANDRHMLVSGPSGSGKTFPIEQECAKAGRRAIKISCAEGITYGTLVARQTLTQDKDTGATVTRWQDGALVRAMRSGAVLILDEIDHIPGSILAVLYAVTDSRSGPARLEVPDSGELVTAAPGFLIAATCNAQRDTTGSYTGNRLSAALVGQRLAAIPADYLPHKLESEIFQRAGAAKSAANELAEQLAKLRALYQAGEIGLAPSTRIGVQIVRDCADGLTLAQAWTVRLLGGLDEEQAKRAQAAIGA